MFLGRFFLFSLLLCFHPVSLELSLWGCEDLICSISGKAPVIGVDYAPVKAWEEVPYLAFLHDEGDKIFCFGILINVDRVLTVASCMLKEGFVRRAAASIKIRVGSLKISAGETRQAESIIVNPKCEEETIKLLTKNCDFAVVKAQSPFSGSNLRTAPFVSVHPDSILSAINGIEYCPYYRDCPCVAFSLGMHNVWSEKKEDGQWKWISEQDGTKSPDLLMYPLKLLGISACNTWSGKCCLRTLHEQLFGDKLYGKNTVRCAFRGNRVSRCMGETGSPIVCSGRVMGLIKGNSYCSLRNRAYYHGEIIYLGMEHGIRFVKDHYKINQDVFPAAPDTSQLNVSQVKPPNSQDNATLAEYEDYYSNFPFHGPTFIVPFLSAILLTIILI